MTFKYAIRLPRKVNITFVIYFERNSKYDLFQPSHFHLHDASVTETYTLCYTVMRPGLWGIDSMHILDKINVLFTPNIKHYFAEFWPIMLCIKSDYIAVVVWTFLVCMDFFFALVNDNYDSTITTLCFAWKCYKMDPKSIRRMSHLVLKITLTFNKNFQTGLIPQLRTVLFDKFAKCKLRV